MYDRLRFVLSALLFVSCAASPPAEPQDPGGEGGAPSGGSPGRGGGGGRGGSGGRAGSGGSVVAPGGAGGSIAGGSGGAPIGQGGDVGSGGTPATGGAPGTGGVPGSGGSGPAADDVKCDHPINVPNAGALGGAVAAAKPGDCLVLADGAYTVGTIGIKGTADKPIVIRAANRGKASIGAIGLMGAEYVVFQGFTHTGGVNIVDANYNRISRGTFRMASGTFVNLTGKATGNRIDHNDMGGLTGGGEGHFVTPTGFSEKTQIDHNHFHDNAASGGNGRESIRLGCCGATYDQHETGNVVEYNLFVKCSGESEMIGMKSSLNTVRYNTIRESAGQISFRAGHKNSVIGNFILGGDEPGAYGIRMLDEDHVVYNNYVETKNTPLRMQHGDTPGFPPIKRATVVFNTFVVRGNPIELGGTGHSIPPTESVVANNLFIGTGTIISEKANGMTLQGNIAFAMGGGSIGVTKPADQIKVIDPKVMMVGDVWKPGAGSPLIGAAVGSFPFVMDDIGHQLRMMPDVGADEFPAPPSSRPLTPADVGPDSP